MCPAVIQRALCLNNAPSALASRARKTPAAAPQHPASGVTALDSELLIPVGLMSYQAKSIQKYKAKNPTG